MTRARMNLLSVGAGLLVFGGPAVWANTAPEVANVAAAQRTDGSKLVDIGYDLADADADLCAISVAVSNDGGSTWDVPAQTFTGT